MYNCNKCWYKNTLLLWRCPSCKEFWTFIKEEKNSIDERKWSKKWIWGNIIEHKENVVLQGYLNLNNKEILRVFWKWIKKWGIYLLWWEPGVWKSTLMLQILWWLENINIWYFSWEENEDQITDRANRLNIKNFDVYNAYILEDIFATIEDKKYEFIIIDSIQTVYSKNLDNIWWSIIQIKYCAERITEFFKKRWITCIIIWHITKDWELWWPKYLEHIVDWVMYLEWDRWWNYRFLRAKKNRFWPSDEVWIFEMKENWLIAVHDYKERVLKTFEGQVWNTLWIWIDNWRPILVSIEILITKNKGKFPQRNSIWYDKDRLNLLIAVLDKHLWLDTLSEHDIFLNIPWEIKFKDTWLDLAIALALYWAIYNVRFNDYIFIWELTLMWKIQKTSFHIKRLKEGQDFNCIDATKYVSIKELINAFKKRT